MQRARRLELAADFTAIHLEPDVETYRPDWRAIANAKSHASAELSHIEFRRPIEHVAAVNEQGGADARPLAAAVDYVRVVVTEAGR